MPEPVLRIAHRGAPLHFRENTIASVRSAFARGADLVEVDIKVTADGEPVVLHDHTLERLWDVDANIVDVALADLPGRDRSEGDRLPTLAELVAATDGMLLLDLPSEREAEAVLRAFPAARPLGVTGDPEALSLIRAARPAAVIAMSWDEPDLPDTRWMQRVRPDYVNRPGLLVTAEEVTAIEAIGSRCSVYTIDDEPSVVALRDAGVHAIISNDIDMLTRVLSRTVQAQL